jgi:hypothetical protein
MQLGRSVVAVLILVALGGCGGKDDSDETAASPSTAVAGAAAELACGGQVCRPLEGPGLAEPVAACCADAFAGRCGTKVQDSCTTYPEPHETCPSVHNRIAGIFEILAVGCCIENRCGLEGFFGSDCTAIETLRENAMGMMGPGAMAASLPEPMPCE